MGGASYWACSVGRWCIYFRRDRGRKFEWGMQAMSQYTQTLARLFDTLPEIANSEAMKYRGQAKAEIMEAYIHLEKAITCLGNSGI